MSTADHGSAGGARAESVILNKLIDDPQMQEMVVMEYERLTPSQIFKRLKLQAKKQGHCLIPNWLSLLLCNLFLFFLFGLMAAAIMLAQSPPGKEKAITAAPLRTNQGYNEQCFTFDSSCNTKMNLWCINGRCQCYNQLYYWSNTTAKCVFCSNDFYYNGTACVCLPNRYLQLPLNTTCVLYKTYNEVCTNTTNLCNPTPGLYCANGRCNCTYDYYWNATSSIGNGTGYCVRYSWNTENCNRTSQCIPSNAAGQATSLVCINGTCQCPTTGRWYWTGDKCTEIKSFNGTCIIDRECDGTLLLVCNNSVCICAGWTPYGTWFWNGTRCVLCPLGWLNYGVYCYYNSQIPATSPVARQYCQSYGGDLLYIESQAEFNFIEPRAATIIGAYKLAHVGYYTINNIYPGLFQWYHGSQFTAAASSNNWWCGSGTPYGQQPTFSYQSSATPQVQACGALQTYSTSSVCMNDWWCSASLPFICKKSQ